MENKYSLKKNGIIVKCECGNVHDITITPSKDNEDELIIDADVSFTKPKEEIEKTKIKPKTKSIWGI